MSKRKRRGKRVFPVKFASDYINVDRRPNPDIITEYHKRVQSTTGPKHNREPVYDNTFQREVPETKGFKREPTKNDLAEWAEDEDFYPDLNPKYVLMQSDRLQRMSEVNSIALLTVEGRFKISLCWSNGRGCWFEREEETFCQKSVEYPSRDSAMSVWKNEYKILWLKPVLK